MGSQSLTGRGWCVGGLLFSVLEAMVVSRGRWSRGRSVGYLGNYSRDGTARRDGDPTSRTLQRPRRRRRMASTRPTGNVLAKRPDWQAWRRVWGASAAWSGGRAPTLRWTVQRPASAGGAAEQLSPQMMGAAVRRCGQGRRRRAKGGAFPRPGARRAGAAGSVGSDSAARAATAAEAVPGGLARLAFRRIPNHVNNLGCDLFNRVCGGASGNSVGEAGE